MPKPIPDETLANIALLASATAIRSRTTAALAVEVAVTYDRVAALTQALEQCVDVLGDHDGELPWAADLRDVCGRALEEKP